MLVKEFLFVIFRIINFGIIIGLIAYVAKKYLLPTLYVHIAHYRFFINTLITKRKEMEEQYDNFIQVIADQKLEMKRLEHNLSVWQEHCEQSRQQEQHEQQQRAISIKSKREYQQENLQNIKTAQEMLPVIIKTMEKDLKQTIEQTDTEQAYIQALITFMKKSSP